MTKENSIGELLLKLDEEIQNPKDSVHQIVLKHGKSNPKKSEHFC